MKKVGTFLAVISPVLAIAVSMLFGSSYGYQAGSSAGSFYSGTVSAFRYALEEGDYAWFFWACYLEPSDIAPSCFVRLSEGTTV